MNEISKAFDTNLSEDIGEIGEIDDMENNDIIEKTPEIEEEKKWKELTDNIVNYTLTLFQLMINTSFSFSPPSKIINSSYLATTFPLSLYFIFFQPILQLYH